VRTFLLVAALALTPAAALASGGVNCSTEGKDVQFDVGSGVSRGLGEGFFQFAGKLTIKAKGVPADFAEVTFEQSHLAQSWLDAKDLRLRIYRERETGQHGYVELTILTKAKGDPDEGLFEGRYDLTVYEVADPEGKTRKFSGKVSCTAE
jgi:hypothetical protein